MYQLWGGGPPFKGDGRSHMTDRSGTKVRLLGDVRNVLHELHTHEKWSDTKLAWVSCTDEPEWAEQLLRQFIVAEDITLGSVVHSSQIFKENKRQHFKQLKAQFPQIRYEEMLFFDNEMYNIRNVAPLGVKCVYCPDGVTKEAWEEGLGMFQEK